MYISQSKRSSTLEWINSVERLMWRSPRPPYFRLCILFSYWLTLEERTVGHAVFFSSLLMKLICLPSKNFSQTYSKYCITLGKRSIIRSSWSYSENVFNNRNKFETTFYYPHHLCLVMLIDIIDEIFSCSPNTYQSVSHHVVVPSTYSQGSHENVCSLFFNLMKWTYSYFYQTYMLSPLTVSTDALNGLFGVNKREKFKCLTPIDLNEIPNR